jgi:cellobiose dehydrogenase (acceptor)
MGVVAASALAQDKYTDPTTGIEFQRQVIDETQTTGGLEWGYALPATGSGNAEYIGYLVSTTF